MLREQALDRHDAVKKNPPIGWTVMTNCPTCGRAGPKVQRVTLDCLLRAERRNEIADEPHFVCAAQDCDTVYFRPNDGRVFTKADLTVRFGLKETDSPRPICYCFDHTIEAIEEEIRRTGRSTVVDRIKADMKGPGCRCEYTNPLGGCCLKTVHAVVADALQAAGHDKESAVVGAANDANCCNRGQPQAGRDRAGALATGGSVLAAMLSSACCWFPLLLIAFGASAAGVAGFFEAYRPYFIAGAVGLLGLGFYMVYFRKQVCEPNSACTTPNRKLRVVNQGMLWAATVLVTAFVFFPNYVGFVFGSSSNGDTRVNEARLASMEFQIEGMTCEGCANILHGALTKLPLVKAAEVDFATKTAIVRYEPDRPVPTQRLIEAIQAAGYHANVVDGAPD